MKSLNFLIIFLFIPLSLLAQHSVNIKARVNTENKTILVEQEIIFFNSTDIILNEIYLNDWNNAFSSKNSALARRFSDEFIRAFHLAKEEDRGFTKVLNIIDNENNIINWSRNEKQVDILKIYLNQSIKPNTSQKIKIFYELKIPNERFTKYGFNANGYINLKDCFLTIPRFENGQFILESNENLDDISNSLSDYSVSISTNQNYVIFSDMIEKEKNQDLNSNSYLFFSKNKQNISLIIQPKENNAYKTYSNEIIEVVSNLEDKKLNEIQIALVIDKVTNYVVQKLGVPTSKKIIISTEDYDKNPLYGVNQLPSFINPFPDDFIFEIKFLKTYLNNLLKEQLQLHHRKDHWIQEGIQHYLIMNYMNDNYPKFKMLGSLSRLKILKGYNLINAEFNDQFYYAFLLMARKNLDQPIGFPKNEAIKFNEQIAGKYKAGLGLHYLDSYLENNIVNKSILDFIELNKEYQTTKYDFEYILKKNTNKDIDWFFNTIINKRDLIDFKFGSIKKQKDSIKITIKNKSFTNVPVPIYGLKNDTIVYKKWLSNVKIDSTFTIPRTNIDKLVLNYKNEVPEYNQRNNWYSLNGFFFNNRPLKVNFFKDLENPYYNQIFYVPTAEYNLYDGIKFGLRINNSSMLDKPFIFNVEPEYSSNTQKIVGGISGLINQNIREGRLYNIKYSLLASSSHYAPNALYTRIIPSVLFKFRDQNFRYNKNEYIQLSQYYVNREKSNYTKELNTDNYTVFNAKYYNIQSEMTKYYSFHTDLQIANNFGKIAAEIQYRKFFEDNSRINLRFFVGTFMYKSTNSDFFSFGIDRPTDYLFNYNLLGRSESTGIYSQQYVTGEGSFKSKFDTRHANQWISTINGSFNIWNWIEVFGDIGLYKNKSIRSKFIYDSGIRLNLVPDYFELYFPIQSSNGFELNQPNYTQKIRFVITLSPKTLISLFTRQWF